MNPAQFDLGNLGAAFLAGPVYFEAVDISAFADPEERDSLGTAFAVLAFRLGEEKERGLQEQLARARAALVANQAAAARERALHLSRLIHGGGTAQSRQIVERSRLFFRETGESADKVIAEVRGVRRAKGLRGHGGRVNFFWVFVRDALLAWLRRHGSQEIPAEWQRHVAHRFARKMASVFSPDRINQKLIAGMAERLNAELLQLHSAYRRNAEFPKGLDALDLISAEEILKLRDEFGSRIADALFAGSDPKKKARDVRENRKAAGEALKEAGFEGQAEAISRDHRIAFVKDHAEAAKRALKIARGERLDLKPFSPSLKRNHFLPKNFPPVRRTEELPIPPTVADRLERVESLILRSRKRIGGAEPFLRGWNRLQTINRIRETWGDFYERLTEPVCSAIVWWKLTTNFATRVSLVAEFIPSVETCRAMARAIYEEIETLAPFKIGGPMGSALTHLSADEIKGLLERYPKPVVTAALSHSDTLELIDRFDRNYRAVRNHLAFLNLQNISQSAAKLPYTMGAKDEVEAIRRAGEVVAAWRTGRWKVGQAYSKEEENF